MIPGGRRSPGRFGLAVAVSAMLHGAAIALIWATASRAEELPRMKTYAVNIVSPPPREAGTPKPETAPIPAAEPAAAPAPQPVVPTEAASTPTPSPPATPKPEPVSEPVSKPAPASKPKEPKPAPSKPKPTPPKAAQPAATKPNEPSKPATKTAPAASKTLPPAAPKPAPSGATERAAPAPSRGANPSAAAASGDGLNVRIEGAEFTDPAYLQNIIRKVQRYFRPPPGSRTDVAEVQFWINRDGSVTDIRVVDSSGAFAFRAAAMEAVEQAGINREFGRLPEGYSADRLPVSFEFRPAR